MTVAPPSPAFRPDPEAVARVPRELAFRHDVLPLDVRDGTLTVAAPEPDDPEVLDALRAATRLRINALRLSRETIRARLPLAYGGAPGGSGSTDAAADDAPVARAVDLVFARAIAAHASDIHIEPAGSGGLVRLRVDGILRPLETIAPALIAPFTARVKLIAGMDIADRRQPQDGRCTIPFERRHVDARVSSIPTPDGEKLVIRLLDRYAAAPELATLGMPPALLERYRAAVDAPWGFIVVTGPTGSGKTTTLYASLAQLDAGARNLCTVEDPIEMRLAGVTQVQVNPRAGLTFPGILRALMRQDPNAVMIGEMRDAETAGVAISAALAGQLVFTTLHANDAPRTLDRLLELGVARHALAAALTAVVAQRLVRKLCATCRQPQEIPPALRKHVAEAANTWYVARGCRACDGSGYSGRTGVYELLLVDDALRDAVANGLSSVGIAELARHTGYRPMIADAMAKVVAGITSFDEVRRVVRWAGIP